MFPCTKCGVCCQSISNIPELKNNDLGNGVCRYFDNLTNECTIYDTRPTVCRIDTMYEVKYNKYFTKQAFYLMNAEACNLLQMQFAINIKYKVKIGE